MKLGQRDFAVCSYCAEIAVSRCGAILRLAFGLEVQLCKRPLCEKHTALEGPVGHRDARCLEHVPKGETP